MSFRGPKGRGNLIFRGCGNPKLIGITQQLQEIATVFRQPEWEVPEGTSYYLYLFDTIDITRVQNRVSRFVSFFLPVGRKNCCVAPSSRRQQRSFALHLNVRISSLERNNGKYQKVLPIIWSECRDSNSRPLEPHSSAIPNFATPGYSVALLSAKV